MEIVHFDIYVSAPSSKPRCLCHNKYRDRCPNRVTEKKPEILPFTPPPAHKLRCNKVGHASRGKAEAHLRHLERLREIKPDWKYDKTLKVYYCSWKACRRSGKPWHVGHKHGGQNGDK